MNSTQYTIIRRGVIANAFFLTETEDKDDMTYSVFLKSIGLAYLDPKPKMSREMSIYHIVDEKKWLFAKLKYGI